MKNFMKKYLLLNIISFLYIIIFDANANFLDEDSSKTNVPKSADSSSQNISEYQKIMREIKLEREKYFMFNFSFGPDYYSVINSDFQNFLFQNNVNQKIKSSFWGLHADFNIIKPPYILSISYKFLLFNHDYSDINKKVSITTDNCSNLGLKLARTIFEYPKALKENNGYINQFILQLFGSFYLGNPSFSVCRNVPEGDLKYTDLLNDSIKIYHFENGSFLFELGCSIMYSFKNNTIGYIDKYDHGLRLGINFGYSLQLAPDFVGKYQIQNMPEWFYKGYNINLNIGWDFDTEQKHPSPECLQSPID